MSDNATPKSGLEAAELVGKFREMMAELRTKSKELTEAEGDNLDEEEKETELKRIEDEMLTTMAEETVALVTASSTEVGPKVGVVGRNSVPEGSQLLANASSEAVASGGGAQGSGGEANTSLPFGEMAFMRAKPGNMSTLGGGQQVGYRSEGNIEGENAAENWFRSAGEGEKASMLRMLTAESKASSVTTRAGTLLASGEAAKKAIPAGPRTRARGKAETGWEHQSLSDGVGRRKSKGKGELEAGIAKLKFKTPGSTGKKEREAGLGETRALLERELESLRDEHEGLTSTLMLLKEQSRRTRDCIKRTHDTMGRRATREETEELGASMKQQADMTTLLHQREEEIRKLTRRLATLTEEWVDGLSTGVTQKRKPEGVKNRFTGQVADDACIPAVLISHVQQVQTVGTLNGRKTEREWVDEFKHSLSDTALTWFVNELDSHPELATNYEELVHRFFMRFGDGNSLNAMRSLWETAYQESTESLDDYVTKLEWIGVPLGIAKDSDEMWRKFISALKPEHAEVELYQEEGVAGAVARLKARMYRKKTAEQNARRLAAAAQQEKRNMPKVSRGSAGVYYVGEGQGQSWSASYGEQSPVYAISGAAESSPSWGALEQQGGSNWGQEESEPRPWDQPGNVALASELIEDTPYEVGIVYALLEEAEPRRGLLYWLDQTLSEAQGSNVSRVYAMPGGSVTCYACGNAGHFSRDCPTKLQGCYVCGSTQHHKANCPVLAQVGGQRQALTCSHCKMTGHVQSGCLRKRKQDRYSRGGRPVPNAPPKIVGRVREANMELHSKWADLAKKTGDPRRPDKITEQDAARCLKMVYDKLPAPHRAQWVAQLVAGFEKDWLGPIHPQGDGGWQPVKKEGPEASKDFRGQA